MNGMIFIMKWVEIENLNVFKLIKREISQSLGSFEMTNVSVIFGKGAKKNPRYVVGETNSA